MPIVITTIFVGLFVIAHLPLTLIVGMRLETGIRFFGGDGDSLLRRMRAHGNYIETVPITLLAMGCAEVLGDAWHSALGRRCPPCRRPDNSRR